MNNTLRTRLLSILFIFGLGIYALLPSIRYQLLSDDAKNNLSEDELTYFESKSIKQGLDLKGGIYIVLEVDLPQLINTLAKNKDKKFDKFLEELSEDYKNNSTDFFTLFEDKRSNH
jgi:SecD/SecF fusion protein